MRDLVSKTRWIMSKERYLGVLSGPRRHKHVHAHVCAHPPHASAYMIVHTYM